MSQKDHYKRWIIWTLAVLFYFYEYFLRVAPGVMVESLLAAFHIGAGAFGTMTAFYLYAYAPMQLPVGMLMDRFGARKLLTLATLGLGVSAFLFGSATTLWVANISRFLMGAGSAFAFVGLVYITSHWFSGKTLALLVGIGNSLGMLGAVFGQGPLSLMVQTLSWRPSMFVMGALGLVLGIVIFLAVRNEPTRGHPCQPSCPKNKPLWHNLKIVTKNPQTWINGIVALCFYTATVAYGGLWLIPFLVNTHGMKNETASFAASMVYMGWIIAGPLIGHFSDKTCNRKTTLIVTTFLSIILFLIINYAIGMSHFWTFVMILLLGVTLSGELLCYSLAIELNPREAKGTALAFTNFLVFVGGSIAQTLVGWLLDWNWDGLKVGGTPVYLARDYQNALLIFPVALLIAFIFSFFIQEKTKPWCQKSYPFGLGYPKKLFLFMKKKEGVSE
ncbi:MAG: MFS transporter [Simkania sp.]|nr:MFS transporter [Simkania sp.]MCB1075071.1 MFS transporter [Simkania sp.]MCP5489885.1 MFS transporter [Chlamydiales bacterium]